MANTSSLSVDQLKRALKISEEIQKLETEMASILWNTGASKSTPVSAKTGKRKYTMSPEAREKIAVAQRARWAKQKKGTKPETKAPATVKPATKQKPKMSAQGLANIKAAQKARWAKVNAEKAKKA